MKRKGISFLPVLILLFLSYCSTTIFIGKQYEPEIIPEKETGKIAFINLFDYTLPIYVKEKNAISYNAGVRKFGEGLTSSSKDKSYRFFINDSLKKGIETGQLTALFPADSVNTICNRNKVDMLLVLDSLNIFFDWETISSDQEGHLKTKDFYLFTRFYLSLYSASGDLIDRCQVNNSLLYSTRPALSGLITIQPSIAKAVKQVESLAFHAGQDYLNKFYPQIVNEPRLVYYSKPLKESDKYIFAGNWNKAIELLEPLAKSQKNSLANKARHNLSVAKEAAEWEGNYHTILDLNEHN